MPKIEDALPVAGLYNGISQQPPSLRAPNQVQTAQNVIFDVRDGASKRPGTWIERYLAPGIDDALGARLHPIVRSHAERYYVVLGNGVFRVYEVGGPRAVVTITPNAQTYLDSFPAVLDRFRLVTAADTTFIVNTEVPTEAQELEGTIDAITAADPTVIESNAHGLSTGDTVTIFESNSTPIIDGAHEVTVVDPNHFSVPVEVTVAGTAGRWACGKLNPLKMPVRMVRTAWTGDGVTPAQFTVDVIDWNQRQSGDVNTNPAPKFMVEGTAIADLTIWRARLGFGGAARMTFSQTDDLYNFYNADSANLVDADPVNLQIGSGQASDIDFIVPIRKSLLVFTLGGQQFEVGTDGALTQSGVRVTPTVAHDYLSFKPVVMDPNIYFASIAEQAVQVYEYAYDEVSLQSTASKITSHVPTLLSLDDTVNKAQPLAMVANPDAQMVFVLISQFNADGDALNGVDIYMYKAEHKDGVRVQQAWTQFVFTPGADGWACWHMCCIGDVMYLLVSTYPNGNTAPREWYIEAMPLQRGGDKSFEPDLMADPGEELAAAARRRYFFVTAPAAQREALSRAGHGQVSFPNPGIPPAKSTPAAGPGGGTFGGEH